MYKKILVPVDGSDTAARGLEEALRLAKSQGSALRLLHVVDDLPAYASAEAAVLTKELLEAMHARGRQILAEAEQSARRQGVAAEAVCTDVTGQPVGEAIVAAARAWPADLIVLGTHGRRGLKRLVLGSDAELVVRASPVPVLLVRGAAAG